MNYSIIPEPRFLRKMKRLAKKYKSMKQDLQRLNDELLADNYISKKELERRYLRAFIQMYRAKKEGWKLKSARELIDEL